MRYVCGCFQLEKLIAHMQSWVVFQSFHRLIWLFVAIVATSNIFADSNLPSLSIRLIDESGTGSSFTISTVLVSDDQEPEFLRKLIIATSHSSTPLLIATTDNRWKELNLLPQGFDSRHISVVHLPPESKVGQRNCKVRTIASERSVEDLQKAGTWVAVTGTGLFSMMFYITSEVDTATAASLMTGALQFLSLRYANLVWNYINWGGNKLQSIAERQFPQRTQAQRLAHALGKLNAAYTYNFLTQAAFMLAVNFGDATKVFGQPQQLMDIATAAGAGLLTGTSWELLFAKWFKGSQQDKKRALVLKYGKQLLMMSISPFLYLHSTRDVAMTAIASFGVLGTVANFFDSPFANAADVIMSKIDRAPTSSSVLSSLLNDRSQLSGWLKKLKQVGKSCQSLLLNSGRANEEY